MAKKFFNKKVYNRKRRNFITTIIVLVSFVGILISLGIINHFTSGKDENTIIQINKSIDHEIFSEAPEKHLFFKKLEGVKLKDVLIDYKGVNFNKVGTYQVKIKIKKKNYRTKINIIDVTSPELILKEISINYGEKYEVTDFVESCIDNSKEKCIIEFHQNSLGSNGKTIDYSSYVKEGTYEILITAKDNSNNEVTKTAKLTIGSKPNVITCNYGNLDYDKSKYITAYLGTNNCAINSELYNNEQIRNEITKIANSETKKIQLEVNKLPNLKGDLNVTRLANPILNTAGEGLVGYSLYIEVTDGDGKVVVSYYLLQNNKRHYVENQYNIK